MVQEKTSVINYREVLQRFQYEDDCDIVARIAEMQEENSKKDYQESRDIINAIVLWKLNRAVNLSDATIDLLYEINYLKNPCEVLEDKKVKALLLALLSAKGIKLAVASAILHFYYPNVFPIIDQRSYRELSGKEYPVYLTKDQNEKYAELYLNYVQDCDTYMRENCPDIPFRFIDKVLYQLDKEKGNKVKY